MSNTIPIANATAASYTAATSGSYTVKISNPGCSATSASVAVIVNGNPAATVTESGPTTICSNSSITLFANTGTGYTYQWLRGGVGVAGNGANTAAYNTDTAGAYSVIVTNSLGCSATSSTPVTVTVNQAPSVTLMSAGSTTICNGDTDRLYVNGGAANYTYQWQMNTVDIGGATSAGYNAVTTGTYSTVVTSTNGCVGNTNAVNVVVYPVPAPVITDAGSGQLSAGGGTFATYQWYYNGQAITGATTATYAATQSGSYTVFVTDGTTCGTMSAAETVSNVGVNSISLKDAVKIYPNPATTVIHIEAPVKVNISIAGIDGRTVLTKNNVKDADISMLANGVYMITVTDENNSVIKIDKLVKSGN